MRKGILRAAKARSMGGSCCPLLPPKIGGIFLEDAKKKQQNHEIQKSDDLLGIPCFFSRINMKGNLHQWMLPNTFPIFFDFGFPLWRLQIRAIGKTRTNWKWFEIRVCGVWNETIRNPYSNPPVLKVMTKNNSCCKHFNGKPCWTAKPVEPLRNLKVMLSI